MNNVTQFAELVNKMQAQASERDESMTRSLLAISEVQTRLFEQYTAYGHQMEAMNASQSESLVRSTQAIKEASRATESESLASVGAEVARQVGAIAQLLITQNAKPGLQSTRDAHSVQLVPDGPPPQGSSRQTPAPQLPSDGLLDWDAACSSGSDDTTDTPRPASESVPTQPQPPAHWTARGLPTASTGPNTDDIGGPPPELLDEATLAQLAEHPELRDLFAALGLRPPPPPAPPEWSTAWAANEIKRRLLTLPESSLARILTSRDYFMAFVRELGEIARPPTDGNRNE